MASLKTNAGTIVGYRVCPDDYDCNSTSVECQTCQVPKTVACPECLDAGEITLTTEVHGGTVTVPCPYCQDV